MQREMVQSFENKGRSFTTEVYRPGAWECVREAIMHIQSAAFPKTGYPENHIKIFTDNPVNITMLLRDEGGNVIGYTLAEPCDNCNDTERSAYIASIILAPDWQRQGLVGPLLDHLEAELGFRGYEVMAGDYAFANGFADALRRRYSDRVTTDGYVRPSIHGDQMHIRVRIREDLRRNVAV